MELKNKKWSHDEFFAMRKEILAQWPTGAEVDFTKPSNIMKPFRRASIFPNSLSKLKKKAAL